MKISEMFPSKYIKADDLQGQRLLLTIMSVTIEEVGEKEHKPVMRFVGKEKGLVLNKTNATSIAQIYGDDTMAWSGQRIELMAVPTTFNGKQVMGIVTLPTVPDQAPVGQMADPGQFRGDSPVGLQATTTNPPHAYPDGLDASEQAPAIAKGEAQKQMESLADDIARAESQASGPNGEPDDIPF